MNFELSNTDGTLPQQGQRIDQAQPTGHVTDLFNKKYGGQTLGGPGDKGVEQPGYSQPGAGPGQPGQAGVSPVAYGQQQPGGGLSFHYDHSLAAFLFKLFYAYCCNLKSSLLAYRHHGCFLNCREHAAF